MQASGTDIRHFYTAPGTPPEDAPALQVKRDLGGNPVCRHVVFPPVGANTDAHHRHGQIKVRNAGKISCSWTESMIPSGHLAMICAHLPLCQIMAHIEMHL